MTCIENKLLYCVCVDSAVVFFERPDMGNVIDVSDVHAASISIVGVRRFSVHSRYSD
jgi:hypothetical protein